MLFACYYHRPWPPGQLREPVASSKTNVEVPDSTDCSKCSGTFFFSIFNGLFSIWDLKPLRSDSYIPLLERIACSEKSVSFYILILPWNVTTCEPKWTRVQASLHLLLYYCARLQVPKHSCFLASQEIAPEIGPAVWVAYKLPHSYRSRWVEQKKSALLLYAPAPHSSGLWESEGQRVVYNSLQWKKIQNGSWCPFSLTASIHSNKSPRLQRLALVSFTVAVKWLRFFGKWMKEFEFHQSVPKLSEENATLVFLLNGNKSLSRGVFRLWVGKQILVYLEWNLGLKVRSGVPVTCQSQTLEETQLSVRSPWKRASNVSIKEHFEDSHQFDPHHAEVIVDFAHC